MAFSAMYCTLKETRLVLYRIEHEAARTKHSVSGTAISTAKIKIHGCNDDYKNYLQNYLSQTLNSPQIPDCAEVNLSAWDRTPMAESLSYVTPTVCQWYVSPLSPHSNTLLPELRHGLLCACCTYRIRPHSPPHSNMLLTLQMKLKKSVHESNFTSYDLATPQTEVQTIDIK